LSAAFGDLAPHLLLNAARLVILTGHGRRLILALEPAGGLLALVQPRRQRRRDGEDDLNVIEDPVHGGSAKRAGYQLFVIGCW